MSGVGQFLQAKKFKDLLPYMKNKNDNPLKSSKTQKKTVDDFPYLSEPLRMAHQDEVIE